MVARIPAVHNATSNNHEPMASGDTLDLTTAQRQDVAGSLISTDANNALLAGVDGLLFATPNPVVPVRGIVVACNSQSIARNVQTTLNSFSSSINNLTGTTFASGILTITNVSAAGYYNIQASVHKLTSTALNLFIFQNGAVVGLSTSLNGTNIALATSLGRTLYLSNGDTLRIDVSWNNAANSGGAETITGAYSGFSIIYLGS
jgi:hypothetical protein